VILFLAVAFLAHSTYASDNIWTNAVGDFVWDTSTASWTSPTVWNNANVDTALFGVDGVGVIELPVEVTVRSIGFNATGYSIHASGLGRIVLTPGGTGSLGEGEILVSSDSVTIDSNISGSGALEKTGAGTLILAGSNNYLGGTVISDGVLQIGAGTNSSTLVGNGGVANSGTLVFNNQDTTVVYSGEISGDGQLIQNGVGGTLVLLGFNTFTGQTIINEGVLQIGNGGSAGRITGDVFNATTIVFDRVGSLTYGGAISGNGNLVKSGAGILKFTGDHAYTGGTTINAGTISIGNGGPTGSIAGDIVDNASLIFDRSDTIVYDGVVTGTGSLEKLGDGVLILTGDNTYSGGTTISSGTLRIGDGNNHGSIEGNVANDNSLQFNNANTTTTFSGVITGSGRVVQAGTNSTLILTEANSYIGGTTINPGTTLQLGTSAVPGNIVGDVVNDGLLSYNSAGVAMTVSGVISGSGDVAKAEGAGMLAFTGVNTYTGTTTISLGRLSLTGSGSIASSEAINVESAGRFNVAGVSGGQNHNGSNFALAAGQTLTGTGTINGDATIRDESILAAGGNLGTTTVMGGVDFDPGSTLAIQLSGPTDTDADRSRLLVSDTLSFQGNALGLKFFNVDVTNAGGMISSDAATYTIATAGSIASTGLNSPLNMTIGADGTGMGINGSFMRLRASGFAPGDQFALVRNDSELLLSFIPFGLPGDYNGDGIVNAADYVVWRNHEGTPLELPNRNPELTGDIGAGDYQFWVDNFGNSIGNGMSAAAIPEPTSVSLFLIAAMSIVLVKYKFSQ
jgi:autotransporter-associated beta strand protein